MGGVRVRHFPNWLDAFVSYASFGEAPPRMYKWVGVSALAGAVRRKIWINMGYFEWIPNFYVVLVAPPGIVSKSTTASIGMNILREVPGIKFGPDVVTWPALVQAMAQATEQFVLPSTGEYVPMSAITIESSEFGNLIDPTNREMVDIFVNLWDGKRGAMTKMTKTQGSDTIVNPFINIIACTTPAWIAGNFPEYMIGGGFTSRAVFVYAEKKHKYVAYPGLVMPPEVQNEVRRHLVADLELISQLAGEVVLSPEAIQWGEAWYRAHYESPPPLLNNSRFGGYLARKQSHLHKLAMILSVAEGNSLVIHPEHLVSAAKMLSEIETDMPKVFAQIGKSEDSQKAGEVLELIKTASPIPYGELYKLCFRTTPIKGELDEIIMGLRAAAFVSVDKTGVVTYLGE